MGVVPCSCRYISLLDSNADRVLKAEKNWDTFQTRRSSVEFHAVAPCSSHREMPKVAAVLEERGLRQESIVYAEADPQRFLSRETCEGGCIGWFYFLFRGDLKHSHGECSKVSLSLSSCLTRIADVTNPTAGTPFGHLEYYLERSLIKFDSL